MTRIPNANSPVEVRKAFQQVKNSVGILLEGASGEILIGAGVNVTPAWGTELTTLTLLTVDNISINGAVISSDTGAISFSNEDLTTTGTVAGINVTSGTNPGHVHTDIHHGATTGLGDDDHTQYSLADGTRDFSGVVVGVDPTASNHLATKEYVDSAISFIEEFFLTDASASIDDYFYMVDQNTGEAESSDPTGSITQNDGQALTEWITAVGVPGVIDLEHGIYSAHVHVAKTGGGARDVRIYFEIWTRTHPGAIEALRATSEVSGLITSKAAINLHAALIADVDIDVTDRIVIKFFANGVSGGNNATITLYSEGTTSSHFSLPISSEVLSTIFLRQDGTKALAGNMSVDAGITIDGRDISADGALLDAIAGGKVAVDTNATPDFLGNAFNDGALRTSTGISYADGGDFVTLTTNDGEIAHDSLSGYDANKHVDHTAVSVSSGSGLTGGGTIDGNQTLALDINGLAVAGIAAGDFIPFWDITATATNKKITFANFEAALSGATDEKVGIDAVATAGYLGAAFNDGVLRTSTGISYADGGDFVTLTSNDGEIVHDNLSSKTIVSHDTTATGVNLTSLTDDSMVDSLHRHSELSASDGTPNQALSVTATGEVNIGTPRGYSNKLNVITANGWYSIYNYGHVQMHNSNSAKYWGLSCRDNGSFDIAVQGTDPNGSTIASSGAKVTILSSGFVGLRTITPLAYFQIGKDDSTDSDTAILFGRRVTTNQSYMPFITQASELTANGNDLLLGAASADGGIVFATGASGTAWNPLSGSNTIRVVITKVGEMGVGDSLIAPDARLEVQTGATEGRQAVTIDQNDIDKAFIDFQGTSAADVANNISSWTGGNSIQGFVLQEINGTERWMPFFDAPTGTDGGDTHNTTATGANLTSLTDNSMADALHRHSELSASDGTPDAVLVLDSTGKAKIETSTNPTLIITNSTPGKAFATLAGTTGVVYDFDETGFFAMRTNSKSNIDGGTTSGATERFTILASGFIGVGQPTPLADFHIGTRLVLQNRTSGVKQTFWGNNSYFDGANNKYIESDIAQLFQFDQSGGTVIYTAPSGTAGNTITFTQRFKILNTGETIVGTGTPDTLFEVETASDIGTQAVTIDQNDADQAFIDFQGTSAASAANNLSTWTNAVLNGFVRMEINGTDKWIAYYNAPTS